MRARGWHDYRSHRPGQFGRAYYHKTWLKRAERALKGKHFQERLVPRTNDGIAFKPLYERRH
ncbi:MULTISPECIES: hypothetical protein [Rhizobium]|uniref:hypothetical protein n=1 Tax=Rhizobium TaxID=379 RepID=UPI000B865CFF|nr:hypothetical protein [Rhizobium miluonense]